MESHHGRAQDGQKHATVNTYYKFSSGKSTCWKWIRGRITGTHWFIFQTVDNSDRDDVLLAHTFAGIVAIAVAALSIGMRCSSRVGPEHGWLLLSQSPWCVHSSFIPDRDETG